jgi:hypothetical protein
MPPTKAGADTRTSAALVINRSFLTGFSFRGFAGRKGM